MFFYEDVVKKSWLGHVACPFLGLHGLKTNISEQLLLAGYGGPVFNESFVSQIVNEGILWP
ncbi:hypothetical protein ACJJIP_04945 [Microbulbifer sp. VTAC004]|uniref:hypothetical protein n=1 Tax=unclassified Microbulbifer TaxID=2619833 RepID=UPI00403A26DA